MKKRVILMFITTAIMLAACESYSSSEKGRENPVDMNNMTESMVVSEDKPDEQEKYPLEAPTEWNSKVKVEGTRAVYTSLDELEKASDLIVIGEYADKTEQFAKYEYSQEFKKEIIVDGVSQNTIKAEKILKGKAPQRIVISQRYIINAQNGELIAFTEMTPMKKGDRWIFFLQYDKERKTYWCAGDYSGRYPMPDEKLHLLCKKTDEYKKQLSAYIKENGIDIYDIKEDQHAGLAKYDRMREDIQKEVDKNAFGLLDETINIELYSDIVNKYKL